MLLRLFLFFICVQLIPHAILNVIIDDEIQLPVVIAFVFMFYFGLISSLAELVCMMTKIGK